MTTARLASLMILLAMAPAVAQERKTADVAIESAALQGARTGAVGPFTPGQRIDATIVLLNRGDDAVSVRRIALGTSPNLTLVDPASDSLDNDDDGEIDEADEGLRHQDQRNATLRMEGGGLHLEPGETAKRSLRLMLDPDARPGASASLSFTVGSTLAERKRSRPQKTSHVFGIAVAPLAMTLASTVTEDITVRSKPVINGEVVLPGGTFADAHVALLLPPAMKGTAISSYRVGPAIECENEPAPMVRVDRAVVQLGPCTIDGAGPARDRTIRLSVPTALKDADPSATEDEVAEWRALSVALEASDNDTLLGRKTLALALGGPKVSAEMVLLRADGGYRTGDPVEVRIDIANTGDRPLTAPGLNLLNDETFLCEWVRIGTGGTIRECDDNVVSLPSVDVGATLTLRMRMVLREDALIIGRTGPEIALTGDLLPPYRLSPVPIDLASHEPPEIEIADAGGWVREGAATVVATIGDTARLRVSGVLPAGRYRGEIRLLARAVDALTGEPVAPVMMDLDDLDVEIRSGSGSTTAAPSDASLQTGTAWSRHVIPFDLSQKTDTARKPRSLSMEADVSLADDPNIKTGHLLEIAVETVVHHDNAASGASRIELLVEEPDVRPKMFSLDDDRVIQPGEKFGVISLACNYGESPAFGTSMTIDMPDRVDLSSEQATTRLFTVPLDAVRSGSLGKIDVESGIPEDTSITIEGQSAILARKELPLDPGTCIGVEMLAPLSPDRSGSVMTANTFASLDAYTGNRDAKRARRYPGSRTPVLRFRIPAVSFGPSTTIQIGNDRRIIHRVSLAVPDYLGAFRVSLDPQSSAGLDWVLLKSREDGMTSPWVNNMRAYPPGSTLEMIMQTDAPQALPLGWVDTSRLRADILTDDGRRFATALRLVVRTGTGSARAIDTDKLVALDRDCDGVLSDELVQDAIFEPGKDATPGDCLVVRISFENAGSREVGRIIIRDALPARTTLLPDSTSVRITPEPLNNVSMPDSENAILEWEFEGLFRPGSVGEVEYRLRLDPLSEKTDP